MLKLRLTFLIVVFSIFGSLFAQEEKPKIGIKNFSVEAFLSEDLKKGFLQIETELQANMQGQRNEFQIDARLFRNQEQLKKIIIKATNNSNFYKDELYVAYPDLWSAEHPNLYQLVLSLRDKNGIVLESTSLSVGFREVKMLGGKLLINGKEIVLKGVKLPKQNLKAANIISRESMLEDIRLLKQLNINAVCASQYRNRPYWYQLCDIYGIYIIDEVNIDSQGIDSKSELSSGTDSNMIETQMGDKERLKEFDKNYPSLITVRNKSETTFIHNQGSDTITNDFDFCNSKLVFLDRKIHPSLMELKKAFQPVDFELNNAFIRIQNNYDFTNLSTYNFEWQLLKDGIEIGKGDFPEISLEPNQSIDVPLPMNGKLFSQDVEYVFTISAKTKEESGILPKFHEVAWEQFEVKSMRGFMFGNLDRYKVLDVNENKESIAIYGDDFEFRFSKISGKLQNWIWQGKNILTNEKGFSFNFWRGRTDNDFGNRYQERAAIWKEAGEKPNLKDFRVVRLGAKEIQIKTEHILGNGIASWKTIYTIAANGELYVDNTFTPLHKDLPELPKLGLTLEFDAIFQQVDWYGRGPFQTYMDRKSGAKIGVYSSSVDEQLENYNRLQENSNHTDVRWFALRDSTGYGVLVAGEPLLEFSARNYSAEYIDQANKLKYLHETDIQKKPYARLDIDFGQTGVAANNSWGSRAHKESTLFAKPGHYRFRMVPIHPDQIDLKKAWKEKPLLKSMEE